MAVVTARGATVARSIARIDIVDRIAVAAGAVALAIRIPSLDLPLLERHGWRETWTAYTALLFHEHGIDLLHSQLPIFGPPFEVPMEFPLQQAIAALVMDTGVAPDLSMRLTNLAMFFLSAALLYGLLRRVAGRVAALAGLVFFLFVPTNILWSRASLVEYGATAGAIGFLWAGIEWRERRRWPLFAVALVAGTLGMLVKPTTPIFWALPLALWRVPGERPGLAAWARARLDPALVALCVAPTAIAYGWTMYADSIKAASPATSFMTSAATHTFYFGTLAERFDLTSWPRNWFFLSTWVVGRGSLALVALGLWAGLRSARPLFWSGVVLAGALPVLVFFGGYSKHDYYWSALTPEVASIVGIAVAWLVAHALTVRARAAVAVALIAACVFTLGPAMDYVGLAYPPLNDYEGVLPRARELAAQSHPDDVVLIIGRAYDPDLAYYARRRALMLTDEIRTDALMRAVATQPYHVLYSWSPAADPISIASYWAWTGVVSQATYTVGSSVSDLRAAPLVATDDTRVFDARAVGERRLLDAPVTIACDGVGHPLPAGRAGTWLRVRPDPSARLSLTPYLAPLPARAVIFAGPLVTLGAPSVSVLCSGPRELVVEAAFDGPAP